LTYLVDTNVISALAPTKAERPTALIDWLDHRSDDLFLSVVTAAEIRSGIAKAAR
jgi:toxin FitB